jgi:hypothetical protein
MDNIIFVLLGIKIRIDIITSFYIHGLKLLKSSGTAALSQSAGGFDKCGASRRTEKGHEHKKK